MSLFCESGDFKYSGSITVLPLILVCKALWNHFATNFSPAVLKSTDGLKSKLSQDEILG